MIFVDSNIPMYLIGADHPNKHHVVITLEKLAAERERLVTSVEVLQEILHRYSSLQKMDFIQLGFDATHALTDTVHELLGDDVEKAKDLVLSYRRLSARDAIHIAVMQRLKINKIFSFDRGFDIVPGIERIPN